MSTVSYKMTPGTITLYKRYPLIKELWHKLWRKPLPYNRAVISTINFIMHQSSDADMIDLSPKKKYSKKEITLLRLLLEAYTKELRISDVIEIVNSIRPNTLIDIKTVDDLVANKYYKLADVTKEFE